MTTVALAPNVLVVNANVPATTVSELIALQKKSPGKPTFGSNGNFAGQHQISAVPIGNSQAQMASQIKTDTERFARLGKDAKITVE